MDYLDPKKKQQKKTQLLAMYVLLGIANAFATILVVYLLHGYTLDRQTGKVIQNGLIYLDTKPESADVYLNGQKQKGRTDSRLVVPEGEYNIELRRDGYHAWKKTLQLSGGSLRRLTYVRLLPEVFESSSVLNLTASSTLSTQSPDKRWLLTNDSKNPLFFEVIDLNRTELRIEKLQLPAGFVDTTKAGTWKVVEWSEDSKNILMSYEIEGKKDFYLLDRETGEKAIKLNDFFSEKNYDDMKLRGGSATSFYLLSRVEKKLYTASIKDAKLALLMEGVLEFDGYDNDVLVFIAETKDKKLVDAFMSVGDKTYKLRSLTLSDKYLLDIAKFENGFVVGIASPSENKIIVYNDPVKALRDNDFSSLPVPATVLKVENPDFMEFSPDASLIAGRGAKAFVAHEFEADRSYSFVVEKSKLAGRIDWLDGQHMSVEADSDYVFMDFDGTNQHPLPTAKPAAGYFFDPNRDFLYSFSSNQTPSATLIRTSTRTALDK